MNQIAARTRGILAIIGILAILGVIAFFAITSNQASQRTASTSSSNNSKGGSASVGGTSPSSSANPTHTPTSTPSATPSATPFVYDQNIHERNDIILAAVGYVAGVDPNITPDQVVAALSPNLNANSTAQIKQIQSQYNWPQIQSEQYLKIASVVTQTVTPVQGSTPNEFKGVDSVEISISKNGKPAVTSPGFEIWTVDIAEQSGNWVILNISKG